MKANLRKIRSLFNALKALNGAKIVVKKAGSPDVVEFVNFQFAGRTAWLIASNLVVLKPAIETFDSAKRILADGLGPQPTAAQLLEAEKEIDKILDSEFEYDLRLQPISLSGLCLDKNNIQPGTLAELAEIIEDK